MFNEIFKKYFMPNPTCSNGCEEALPVFKFDDCQPEVYFSEIQRIFIGKKSIPAFTNWKAAGEWLTRMASTGDDRIVVLTVIGDKPAGASVVKDISNGRKVTIGKDHTLNWTIDDVSDENYEAMRAMECGGQYKFWWETQGGKMYGGNEGVEGRTDVNNVQGRGRDEIETIVGSFTWRSKFHPERADSPIFGTGGTSAPTTFDTTIPFDVSATPAAAAGVTGVTDAIDPEQKFEFNATPSVAGGLANTMDIEVGGVQELSVSFLAGRAGDPFRYTDKAGVQHSSTFVNGTRSF